MGHTIKLKIKSYSISSKIPKTSAAIKRQTPIGAFLNSTTYPIILKPLFMKLIFAWLLRLVIY